MPQTLTIGSANVELPDKLACFARQEAVFAALLAAEIELLGINEWCQTASPTFIEQGLAPILRALVERLYVWTADWPPGAPGHGYIEAEIAKRFLRDLKTGCGRLDKDRPSIENIFFGRYGAAYTIATLDRIQPLNSESHIRDRAVLLLEFTLAAAPDQPPTIPPKIDAKLIYKPADVEPDCFLLGDTRTLGLDGNGHYVFRSPRDGGTGLGECPSVAEILNESLGESDAFPTYAIWPAVAGSQDRGDGEPYGYVEYLEHDLEQRIASGKKEVETFYRCFGRLTALAYVFCIDDICHQNVLVHLRKPYFINLESLFTKPFSQVADTLIFDRDKGPLYAKVNAYAPGEPPTPACLPYRLLERKDDALRVVEPKNYAAELQEACLEGLQTLAKCAGQIEKRLETSPALSPRTIFMQAPDCRKLFAAVPEKVGKTRSYGSFESIDALEELALDAERRNWTRAWFDKALADIRSMLALVERNLASDKSATAKIKNFKENLGKEARASNFNQITGEKLSDGSDIQLARRWGILCEFADYLSWRADFAAYDPGIESSWEILPKYALKPQAGRAWLLAEAAETPSPSEPSQAVSGVKLPAPLQRTEAGARIPPASQSAADNVDCRKFGVPFYCRRIQDAELRDACGNVLRLPGTDNAPVPPLQRATFFPEPIAPKIIERLRATGHPGFQDQLLGQIARLMK